RSGGDTTQSLTVTYSIGGTASNGADYSGIGATIVIPGKLGRATRRVRPYGDKGTEGAETVILTIVASSDPNNDYTIGASSSDTVTIADNVPTVTVSATDAAASEVGLDPGTFTFTRSAGDTTQALTVTYSIGGTASNGADYSGIGATIVIPG